MKLNRLETHDRLQHFIQDQSKTIFQGAEECLKKNPDSLKLQERSCYIYLFAHPRIDDDGIARRMLWQPRLVKPLSQTNSYLFRAQSKTDILEICWMIPPRELWSQFQTGNVTESSIVQWSIQQFKFNREKLEEPDKDDLPLDRARDIYMEILTQTKPTL